MPASEDYGPLSALKQYLDYRPLGNDPWTGLMKGQQDLPLGGAKPRDETVLYRTASPLVNITEGDIGRATEVGLAASGGGLKGQQIKAYHSSPHDFDKFDLGKIGTGEGAQVYGHGLYFAENPAVSGQGGQYWRQFLPRFTGPEADAAQRLSFNKFDREAAAESVQRAIEGSRKRSQGDPSGFHQSAVGEYQKQLELLRSGKPVGPRTYEVNINADPAHMLDWDKPLRSQSPEVVEGLQKAMNPTQWKEFNAANASTAMRQGFIGSDLRTATDKIYNAGIPGIKYLDEGSRPIAGQIAMRQRMLADPSLSPTMKAQAAEELAAWQAEKPTSNYVVRDPTILDIVKKYGLAGLASAPALTSGLRDRENPP